MENHKQELHQFLNSYQDQQLLLTPNSRLRRWLLQALGNKKSSRGSVAATAAVFSMQEWIQEHWLRLQDQAWQEISGLSVIDASVRLKLWREIILESAASEHMINPELLAKQAEQAYCSLQQWRFTLADLEPFEHSDNTIFQHWAKEFQQRCKTLGFISNEDRIEKIISAFAQQQLSAYDSITIMAFDDLSPLLQALLQQATAQLRPIKLHQSTARAHRRAFDNRQQEIQACAHWAEAILEREGDQSKPPSIGIIDPSLGQDRKQIERIFSEVFEPQAILPNSPRYTLPFNFSAGIPLAETPIINTALQLLHLNHPIADLESLTQLLNSRFWGDDRPAVESLRELDGLLCEHQLRRLRQDQIRSASLRQACAGAEKKLLQQDLDGGIADYQSLHQLLQIFGQQQRAGQQKNTAKFWSQRFFSQLQQLGWPGQRRLDSNEFQQVSQLYQLLEQLPSLDQCSLLLSLSEALKALSDLAHSHHFQAKTPDSPIQIMGALEAAGMHFDHCWVMGMHAQQWPPKPQPSALLPSEMQKRHQMPHANAERELAFADSLTDSYRHCASEVVFSYPQKQGDEELVVSPLLHNIPLRSALIAATEAAPEPAQVDLFSSAKSLPLFRRELVQARRLQWIDCRQGPPISAAETQLGGSAVLQQQAACPFNAFAIYRLGARENEAPVIGLSPIERGNILHLAMELLWRQLSSQQQLLQLSDQQLTTLCQQKIDAAIADVLQHRFDLGPKFRQLEAQRLSGLIAQWMALEKQRPAFKVVGIETSCQVELHQLKLNLRLDRIDQNLAAVDSNYLMVIDYKTGEPDIRYWQGDRMQEPQLPLYTLSDPNIQAIAFAQLNVKGNQFKGIGEQPLPAAGVRDCIQDKDLARYKLEAEWSQLRQQWQQQLTTLAQQYCHGDCRLDFKDINAQRYSEQLKNLQRLDETSQRRLLWQDSPAWLQEVQL